MTSKSPASGRADPGLPSTPVWRAIAVPGDKNTLRPDLVFAHRVWYRTRVDVPATAAGRSFFLVFPQNNSTRPFMSTASIAASTRTRSPGCRSTSPRRIKPGLNEI